ncbi:MAG: hypothetical protein RBT34_05680 [Anaerolineaceae bacterium]|jgi:hypothetical protein|nr:hypothetical protein [Anaerolineaceae bacterium]
MKKYYKILILVGIAVLTALCILLSVKLYDELYDLFGPPSDEVAVGIAARIGTEPNWEEIRSYMLESIEPGMTKEQDHAVFDEIGYWEIYFADTEETKGWHPDYDTYSYREHIEFSERSRRIALKGWLFQYDENDILLQWAFAGL